MIKTLLHIFLLLGLLFLAGCNDSEIILEDLSQRDANIVIVSLHDKNIPAKKIAKKDRKGVTYSISVEKKIAPYALEFLVVNQLPKNFRIGLKDVYPPGEKGLIPTKSDEKARLNMAMQGELEELIKLLPGIIDARVVLSIENEKNTRNNTAYKGASVAIIYLPVDDDTQSVIEDDEIKTLIASSVDGLDKEKVVVLKKVLSKVHYLGDDIKSIDKNKSNNINHSFAKTDLYLISLTILSLLLAAYAIIRSTFKTKKNNTSLKKSA